MDRALVIVALLSLLLVTFWYVMHETYLDASNGAALVCYWAPQTPTMAIPIPKNPLTSTPKDGPQYGAYLAAKRAHTTFDTHEQVPTTPAPVFYSV